MSRRVYAKPPITEAICEFRYRRDEKDVQPLAEFLREISDEYNGVIVPAVELQPPNINRRIGSEGQIGLHIAGPKIQVWNSGKTALISLTPSSVSSHVVAPYCGWEEFRPRTLAAHAAYTKAFGSVPIARIGIRYVNKITIPRTEFELGDFFLGVPNTHVPATYQRFASRLEGQLASSSNGFRLTIASVEGGPDEKSAAFLMDIDVYREFELAPAESDVAGIVEGLRNDERTLFEAAITDSTRALFKDSSE